VKISVHPNLARIATREGYLIPFVIWSALRDASIKEDLSSNPLKSQAKKLLRSWGLNYTDRHYQRIWNNGLGIFWGLSQDRLWLRSFRRVSEKLSVYRKPCDESCQAQDLFVLIQLSKSLKALEAEVYHAWLLEKGECTLSRDTITDLFGFSHDTQRSLEAILGDRLKVFYNYAHLNLETYSKDPQALPEHHFSFDFEREIRFDEDKERVTYIQYQLPNGYLARPGKNSESDSVRASNRARYAMFRLLSQDSLLVYPKRRYYLKSRDFERFGSLSDYVRVAYQGRKKLFLLGHYL